ncbi:hypothetical protein [Roseimicrobium sp. ORNL1]|uniref:hypothetical protein n=1 Tax=Roseimicrobium sp. ORNL1 TaxID=2711231 RepID=UPI0013E15C3E|nr:hypothetical protein [Roseimicrobium sp. ORNL1]QIF03060.1 hypothetical protein G5S37_16530 [Roseimicrobium sp. ORNL1]
MSLLYPRFKLSLLPLMAWIGVQGALIAGAYGILHDQITYTISREYFTEFKAEQFRYMDFGWPERVYTAQIGFLATWWVGFIAGWFLARLAVPHLPEKVAVRWCRQAFVVLIAVAAVAGLVGAGVGWWVTRPGTDPSAGDWQEFAHSYGVRDVPGFIRAACIHNGSYIGALLGLTGACFWLRRRVRGLGETEMGPPRAVATAES